MKLVNVTVGQRFGRLVVQVPHSKVKNGSWYGTVICDCGTIKDVKLSSLTSKSQPTKSCGCLNREIVIEVMRQAKTTHGSTNTKLYRVRASMIERCYSPNCKSYINYGARGINVDISWRNSFVSFQNWAVTSGYKEGLTLERIDNDRDYCPSNCCWVSPSEQSYNKQNTIRLTLSGETKSAPEWLKDNRCQPKNLNTLYERIRLGWSDTDILTKPIRGKRCSS